MYQMMKNCVSYLALWMLLCAVKADITNFADSSSIPDITTPMAQMASRSSSVREGASGDGVDALGGAFHQVAQGLLRVQEALRLQQQQAERRAQEALRLQQQREETASRDAVRHMEQKLCDRDEAMQRLREECSSNIQRMETQLKAMEERFVPSARIEDGGHVSINQLESRMDTLEAKLKKAFEQMFPNMEAFNEHSKRLSSSEASSAVTVAPTTPSKFTSTVTPPSASTSPSPSPFPSASATLPTSVSSPNSTSPTASPSPSPSSSQSPSPSLTTPTSTSTSSPNTTFSTSCLPRACDEQCEKQRVQRRIMEFKERAREGLSALGEQLLAASRNGRLEDVRRLLDAGADVNSIGSYGNPYGNVGSLMISASEVNEALASLLLRRGANVNAINVEGWTALHYAAARDSSGRVVTLLLRAGADVDAREEEGWTPLHFAALHNNDAAVRALLESGARKDLRIWSGFYNSMTPYYLSTSDAIRNLLRP